MAKLGNMPSASGAMTPGQRIKAERQRQGLTQDDLMRRAGVSLSTLQSIERDKYVRRKSLRLVAEALGIDIAALEEAPESDLSELSDEELVKELRRRHGRQAAAFVETLLAEDRKSETGLFGSRSDNEELSDNDES